MRQTTHTTTRNPAGPLADAGPYDYDLPVARGGGHPLTAPPVPARPPAWRRATLSAAESLAIFAVVLGSQFLRDLSGWRLLHCFLVMCAAVTLLRYWTAWPRPKQSFPRWALKVVGIWLNCYVGFVSVPESLRGLLPAPLAFGLPAFLTTAALYCVVPAKPDTGQKWPFWQWLLVAAWAAVVWGWTAPGLLK